MGALHPVLFFMLVYGISLFLAIFVCRTVYYSINDQEVVSASAQDNDLKAMNATAYR
jgi:hypothetical protein